MHFIGLSFITMKKKVLHALLVDRCVQRAVTDENHTFEMDLGYRFGYLSVTASGLFMN
jgi:hypothetical protein